MTAPAGRHWALSASPISSDFRRQLEERLGVSLHLAVLTEIRQGGPVSVWQALQRIDGDVGYVVMEDPGSTPLVPLLRLSLALSRCRRLAIVDGDGVPRPFSRGSAWLELARLAYGSIRGMAAAVLCWVDLLWQRASPRRPPGLRGVRRGAYLKTNLWFGLKAGGSVGHVAGVANALRLRCERVDLFSLERPPLLDPAVDFHATPFRGPFGAPFELNCYVYDRQFVRQARRALRAAPPDFLYQRLSLGSYAGLALARRLGVPLVLEYNGSEVWVARHWGRPLYFPRLAELAEEVPLRQADLVVTVSDVLGQELVERGIPPERVLVHPNCVDPDRFDPKRYSRDHRTRLLERYGIPADATVCGFIGTFGRWHGVTLLAEGIRDLIERDPEWVRQHRVHFLLVGDGLLMPRVREILADPGLARVVVLTGLVEQHQAPGYLAAADVVLSPHVPNADGSAFFGSPTKLFEYMAMAKGIVASDLAQIGEVLRRSYRGSSLPTESCHPDEDRLAVLVTPGDREQLIAGLRFLVERPDYRDVLGRNARQEVLARYTWQHNVDTVVERLRTLTGPTGAGQQAGVGP